MSRVKAQIYTLFQKFICLAKLDFSICSFGLEIWCKPKRLFQTFKISSFLNDKFLVFSYFVLLFPSFLTLSFLENVFFFEDPQGKTVVRCTTLASYAENAYLLSSRHKKLRVFVNVSAYVIHLFDRNLFKRGFKCL